MNEGSVSQGWEEREGRKSKAKSGKKVEERGRMRVEWKGEEVE